MIIAQTLTAHNNVASDLCWVTVSFLVSFFWNSKVMETVVAVCNLGSRWDNSFLPLKNLIMFVVSIFVFLVPFTLRYSHERIAKKKAPMNKSHIAFSNLVVAILWNFWRIEPVTAACCLGGGSVFA
jgi:hypothetical protein